MLKQQLERYGCSVKLWDVTASIKTPKTEEKMGNATKLGSLKALPTKSFPVYTLRFSRRTLLFIVGVLSKGSSLRYKLKAKFIAGRIIPAIATSIAMATFLGCLELYKVLDKGHKLEEYRNTFANLALPLFSMAEVVLPKVIKHGDRAWTVWEIWIIKNNPPLREHLEWLNEKGLNAYSIPCGVALLFNNMFPRHKDRLNRKEVDLAKEVAKVEIPPYRSHVDVAVACEDDEDTDIDIPQVSIYFKHKARNL